MTVVMRVLEILGVIGAVCYVVRAVCHLAVNWKDRRLLSLLLLLLLLLPRAAKADTYCNCGVTESAMQANCTGGDGSVKRCDDFERGNWGATYCDVGNAANFGWSFTPFPPGGSHNCGDALDTVSPAPGTGGFSGGAAGTSWAATTGPWSNPGEGQAYLMADADLKGATTTTNGFDHVWLRRYVKKIGPFTNGGMKTVTINYCCAGGGGIRFGGLTTGGSGQVLLAPQGSGTRAENMLIPPPVDTNYDSTNVSNWSWTADVWWFEEIEIGLNTPGTANGVYRHWMNNCGASGVCTGSPTLRAEYTNLMWRQSGNTTNIGTIWYENWANPGTEADGELYDQVVWATSGPIGFMGASEGESSTFAVFLQEWAPWISVGGAGYWFRTGLEVLVPTLGIGWHCRRMLRIGVLACWSGVVLASTYTASYTCWAAQTTTKRVVILTAKLLPDSTRKS